MNIAIIINSYKLINVECCEQNFVTVLFIEITMTRDIVPKIIN